MQESENPGVSVVIPMYNEKENVGILINEVAQALHNQPFEIIVVDDGSNDGTREALKQLQASLPQLKPIRHKGNFGQSIGIISGVTAARYPFIATLDGDGQNDPADIPRLMSAMENQSQAYTLIAGHRANRKDSQIKLLSSKIANTIRRAMLKDNCPDTGCGLKLFRRDDFLSIPHFNHLHRYLPALFQAHGGQVINVKVNHRPRTLGQSKYGVMNRLWVGIMDLMGVAWLIRRTKVAEYDHADQ